MQDVNTNRAIYGETYQSIKLLQKETDTMLFKTANEKLKLSMIRKINATRRRAQKGIRTYNPGIMDTKDRTILFALIIFLI
jgi:hypothetical protein